MNLRKAIDSLPERVVTSPLRVAVFSLAGCMLLMAGLARIQFNDSHRALFSEANPQLRAYDEFEDTFNQIDNMLFVIEPEHGDVFTPATLAAVSELTEQGWQLPFAVRVDSMLNFPASRADEDLLVVETLFPEPWTQESIAVGKARALREPMLLDRLIPPDGTVTGVNVSFQLARDDNAEESEVLEACRALARSVEVHHPGHRIYMTGTILINTSFKEAAMGDMESLGPVMFLCIVGVTWLLLRTVAGTLTTAAIVGLSVGGAMGLMGWTGVPLTAPSSSAPIMILTLAVANCIHIISTMRSEMERGMARRQAVASSLRINRYPVFLTSTTTAIGFLGMNFSEVPPLRDLGNFTAAGVMVAFVLAVTLLPAILCLAPVHVPKHQLQIGRFFQMFGAFVARYPRRILAVSLATVAAAAACLPLNELNDPFIKYFGPSIPFRRDTDFIMERLTGMYQIYFGIDAEGPDEIVDPAYLQVLDQFANWCREQTHVQHVESFSDVIKRINMNMHGDNPSEARIPESRELAAQYLLLYEMSLPFGHDLTNFVSTDRATTRLTVTMDNVSTREVKDFASNAEAWLRENGSPAMAAQAVGAPIMFAHVAGRNMHNMMVGAFAALVVISAMILVSLRSVRYGLISLAPNLVPAIAAFGIWGLINGQIGLGISVVCAMTLGIVVDDTVHFISKYVRVRREMGLSPAEAVQFTFRTIGMALSTTSAILATGFWVLSLSSFRFNSGMGQLTAITIGCALVADFFLLPALLLVLDRPAAAKTQGGLEEVLHHEDVPDV